MPYSFYNITNLIDPPQKIISTVPSITELLFSLQLQQKVVAITKFCILPNSWFTTKPIIGGTKNLNIEVIKALQPDLVIANKEENIQSQIETIASFTNVHVTDVFDIKSALQMVQTVAQLTHTTTKGNEIITNISNTLHNLKPLPNKPKAAYLIWQNPFMTIGNDTFIHQMLQHIGVVNVFGHLTRYPTINIQQLQQAQCDFIFLSSEPFPFAQKHIDALQQHLPNTKIVLVNGQMFSWYGSRLLHFANYYNNDLLPILK